MIISNHFYGLLFRILIPRWLMAKQRRRWSCVNVRCETDEHAWVARVPISWRPDTRPVIQIGWRVRICARFYKVRSKTVYIFLRLTFLNPLSQFGFLGCQERSFCHLRLLKVGHAISTVKMFETLFDSDIIERDHPILYFLYLFPILVIFGTYVNIAALLCYKLHFSYIIFEPLAHFNLEASRLWEPLFVIFWSPKSYICIQTRIFNFDYRFKICEAKTSQHCRGVLVLVVIFWIVSFVLIYQRVPFHSLLF